MAKAPSQEGSGQGRNAKVMLKCEVPCFFIVAVATPKPCSCLAAVVTSEQVGANLVRENKAQGGSPGRAPNVKSPWYLLKYGLWVGTRIGMF